MAVRPIILRGPGKPHRRFPTQPSTPPVVPLPRFVSNASAPQLADYGMLAGFALVIASAVTPQGKANAAEYEWGTHAQAIHQAEGVKSVVFPSARTPPAAATPNPIRSLWAAPEQVDLSISGWSIGGGQAPQGAVPVSVFASQADPSQLGGRIWPSVRTPPAAQSSPLGAFLSVREQPYATVQPTLTPSQPAPVVVSYAFRSIAGGPQLVDLTQQGWILRGAPQPQGAVPALTRASPQPDPSQVAAQLFPSVPTPPAITGATVAPMPSVPPQFDPSANPSAIWTPSTFSPSLLVSPQPGGPMAGEPRRTYGFRRQDLAHFYDDFSEAQILDSVEETIKEAEKPGKPEQTREIGALLAVDTLARAYGRQFKDLKEAHKAIAELRAELGIEEINDEDVIAIMMILAASDEP